MSAEPRRILVVEDSPTMIKLYRTLLGSQENLELVVARDGVEGLDRAAQEGPLDLLIVDINMPRMDGLAFLRRLREELGLADVPALVVSTEAEEADRRAALEAGAEAYLPKPVAPDKLRETVRRLLEAGR